MLRYLFNSIICYVFSFQPPTERENLPTQVGNKTECALLGLILELGETYQSYRDDNPESSFVKVFTFNSARKSMSTAIPLEGGGYRLFTKGASEMVLRCCSHILDAKAQQQVFGKEDHDNLVNKVIEPMASFGLRTIGIA